MLKNRLIFKNALHDLAHITNHIRLIMYCILALRHKKHLPELL